MKNNLKKYYNVIGMIQAAISRATVLEDTLRECITIIKDNYNMDDAVVWYHENEEKACLHPNYSLCPLDITAKEYRSGEGIVGTVYETEETYRISDMNAASNKDREELTALFPGLSIASMVCVPLSNKTVTFGCIQFIAEEGSPLFSDEDADLFEIIALMMAIQIDKNPNIQAPMKTKRCLLSAKNIQKEFVNGSEITKVLKGVNLDIYEGEFLVLLGESGCGKSTLLNIISGLDTATEGEFSFMGQDLSHATGEELSKYRRENIGFIFQSYNLMPNLTAKQNLDLIAELVEHPMKSTEALALVGLSERVKNYPSQLSGGQQQRVSIARALVKNPKLLMADEPTAALDYTTSIEVLGVLGDIVAAGGTLVMVTHNEEITRMADRVIRMRDGKAYEIILNRHPVPATELVW